MRAYAAALLALCAALAIAGCDRGGVSASSPGTPGIRLGPGLAGQWVGQAKLATGNDLVKLKNALSDGKMTGESRLTLNGDGTGFLKVAKQAEKPVRWKQEGQKVILQRASVDASGGSAQPEAAGDAWVGTLSDDGRSLVIDMGDVKIWLTKE